MTSAIDATKPISGNPTTQSVRDNFAAAKAEIEAIQNRIGFADYNDLATQTTPINVSASTWTKLTNDTLGPNTHLALPGGITSLWNSINNQLDFTQCPLDSMIDVRVDITVTTTTANQVVKLRALLAIGSPAQFDLEASAFNFKTSGVQRVVMTGSNYIGSTNVKNYPGELQIWSDASATVKVNGWYIRVIKRL